MSKKNSKTSAHKLTNLEKKLKKFRKHLATDEDLKQNLFRELKSQYENKDIDFYDLIDQMQSYNKMLYQYAEYLSDTGIGKIEISDNNVFFTTRETNISLVFNGKDRRGVPFDMMNLGSYEKQESVLFDKLINDGMVILDVGANIGWYSLLWGKKFRNVKIHAFEPIVETCNYLIANVVLNGLTNVTVHNFGLSDREEEVKFYYYPGGACLASARNVIGYEQARQVSCLVKTLDSIENFVGTENIDLIKCDVEGAELLMLRGGVKAIARYHPIIALELIYEWSAAFNYHPNEAIDFLRYLNYRVFLPHNNGLQEVDNHIASDFERQNYFFLHAEKHKKIINKMT